MIHHSILPYLPKVVQLLELHKITSAYLFGSVLTENFNHQSDIDFLVNIQPDLDPVDCGGHLWDLTYELEELFQRKVDLLTERSLKNPYFIDELNRTKYPIYGS